MNSGGSKNLSKLWFLVAALLVANIAVADCVEDLRGNVYCGAGLCVVDSKGVVWCSRHRDGDAEISLDGQVMCGKGQCAKGSDGLVFCSSEIGGAVLVDSRGRVRCYGQCELATAENCESNPADMAER